MSEEKIEVVEDFDLDASEFVFTEPDGDVANLEGYEGEWVVVNFWATWCPPCVAELPSLSEFQETYEDRLTVLPLAQGRESHPELEAFLDDLDINNLTPYKDNKGASFRLAKARGLPTSLVVNPKGEVVARIEGEIDWMAPSVRKRFDKWLSIR